MQHTEIIPLARTAKPCYTLPQMSDPFSDSPSLDPISALQDKLDREDRENREESPRGDPKEKTRRILLDAAPHAARRLATISRSGDDKEAVSASQAILDRTGFGKIDSSPHAPPQNLLSNAAVAAALLGIGRIFGLKEAENLVNVTPPLSLEGALPDETPPKTQQGRKNPRKQPVSPVPGPKPPEVDLPVHLGRAEEARTPLKKPSRRRISR